MCHSIGAHPVEYFLVAKDDSNPKRVTPTDETTSSIHSRMFVICGQHGVLQHFAVLHFRAFGENLLNSPGRHGKIETCFQIIGIVFAGTGQEYQSPFGSV